MSLIEFMQWFWWILGGVLILLEFLLPGLVVVFVGMGALTVAIMDHYQVISGIVPQLLTWFVSSIVYIFTLRLLVIKIYPSDIKKQNINEDKDVFGEVIEVIKDIKKGEVGRVKQAESTWPAISKYDGDILSGEKVKIVGRENLTWIVSKEI